MNSPIPGISISLAPPEEIPEEPYSPFSSKSWHVAAVYDDGLRAQLLSPPPTGSSPRFPRQLSPLCPPDSPVGSGLQRERFEAMLKASKERSMAVGAKKAADLRKEIAQKTHKTKQLQRRALFLSKLREPPSPSAISLPKTPPESPAIFHYTLPSPGLNSPLALFDTLEDDAMDYIDIYSVEPWVEQVDFRLPQDIQSKSISRSSIAALRPKLSRPGKPIPSLDQITARLSSHKQVSPPNSTRSPMRLPAFLQSHKKEPPRAPIPTDVSPTNPLSIAVGRLKMPVRSRSASPPQQMVAPPVPSRIIIPSSPRSPVAPKLQVTTTIVSRSATLSPTELSERNVFVLTARAGAAKDMLSTLKRRSSHPSSDGLTGYDQEDDQKERRRRSSPAELPKTKRLGFEHPVLSIPGGF